MKVVRQDDTGINQNESKTKVTGLENKPTIEYRDTHDSRNDGLVLGNSALCTHHRNQINKINAELGDSESSPHSTFLK